MVLNENFNLSNGKAIPSLAFGTWQISNEDVVDAVKCALKIGYRHIDTAAAYENEKGVGQAIKESGIDRENIFITTKIPAEIKTYEGAKKSIEDSLEYLGVDSIDLMLIHAPRPWDQMFSGTDKTYFEENLEVYKAMEEAYNDGKIRSLGVSNFDERDLKNIFDNCTVKPVVNQIQVHIGFTRFELINYCKENDVLVMAYAPNATGKLPGNSEVGEIAKTYNVSTPQLSIRYDYQLGLLPIPRSTNPDHIKENAMIDFEIKEDDMEKLYKVTI